ncbi:MAG: hypothetical protein IT426_10295 [Pirellulales bacterium]|nr:hypothetical protein [Pirellulales bacterium]
MLDRRENGTVPLAPLGKRGFEKLARNEPFEGDCPDFRGAKDDGAVKMLDRRENGTVPLAPLGKKRPRSRLKGTVPIFAAQKMMTP